MRTFILLLKRAFYVILMLVLLVSLFLLIYYHVTASRLKNEIDSLPAMEKVSPGSDQGTGSYLNLLPVPARILPGKGVHKMTGSVTYHAPDSITKKVGKYLEKIPGIHPVPVMGKADLEFIYTPDLPIQGYSLDITPGALTARYSSLQGLFYSIITMKVLTVNYGGSIPCVYIDDKPELQIRGAMLDISRNKIPDSGTLKQIINLLTDLKYNHLQLYVEGFSFAYPSFRELWEKTETPLTPEEIQDLDSLCRGNFIDLVPNQNMFGHMMSWLATDRFKDLAECPDGFKMMGLVNMKGTLDPSDPGSFELVTKMTNDLLPSFTSSSFNVNLDEPFELGKGKSKELCKTKGTGQVYMDYALKIHELVRSRDKEMLMWGDIILRHPDLVTKIPKDVTVLDWGYESTYPYEKNCKNLQAAGVRYLVCPGTNSWTSITGRTDNMLRTVANATSNGARYGASGMLITDWGDMGHWQYLPVSYAGLVTGSSLSWNTKDFDEARLSKFLTSFVFRDRSGKMGKLVLDLGRYSRYEELPLPNMTSTMISLQYGLRDEVMIRAVYKKVFAGIKDIMSDLSPELIDDFNKKYEKRHAFNFEGMKSFVDSLESELHVIQPGTPDSSIVRDEFLNSVRLIKLGMMLQFYTANRKTMEPDSEKEYLAGMKQTGSVYLEENRRLWMARNKPGNYEVSVAPLVTLMRDIDKRVDLLGKTLIRRKINRLGEKIMTAAGVLYLKFS
ncbi:MAG: family 20 glycosylhydrolase [Bacteroidales bacterium]